MAKTLGYLRQPVHMVLGPRPHRIQDQGVIDSHIYGRIIGKDPKKGTHLPRTADVGPAHHARVEELIAQGAKKSEAFRQVAKEELPTGTDEELRKKGNTVATNYYRIERQKAEGSDTPSEPKRRGRPPGTKNKPKDEPVVVDKQVGYDADSLTALGQAKAALEKAIEVVRAEVASQNGLQTELAELREFKEKVTSVIPS